MENQISLTALRQKQFPINNGVGLPAEIRIEDTPTLGLRLVRTLVEQLGGSLVVANQGGAKFEIHFSDNLNA